MVVDHQHGDYGKRASGAPRQLRRKAMGGHQQRRRAQRLSSGFMIRPTTITRRLCWKAGVQLHFLYCLQIETAKWTGLESDHVIDAVIAAMRNLPALKTPRRMRPLPHSWAKLWRANRIICSSRTAMRAYQRCMNRVGRG